MRPIVPAIGVALVAGAVLLLLSATGTGPFGDGGSSAAAPREQRAADRFDSGAALRLVREQVRLGPRPAGSAKSRRLARRIRGLVPAGRFQSVPGGLRNVVGRIPGRGRGFVVVGAHYDTKDVPGFVGAVDGASGTAVALQLARTIRPRTLRRTLVFVFFDGEESPRGSPDSRFEQDGLRGSKVAAARFRDARAMVLLDYVGNRRLRIPREGFSNAALWRKLRSAARRAGAGSAFPATIGSSLLDDHLPFLRQGVPSIDLIDFDFPCFHRRCDDMSAISERSLDRTGETLLGFLASL
jgi:glutaminyl-peptide cyclotransferase